MSDDLRSRLQAALGDAYLIERELGGGGMSRLFLATEASLGRKVVIKLLPPELASEVSAARFRQEIELAAHLQHPNILPVLSAGARDGLLYYVMPYVAGESLRHRLAREGRLPVADALRLLHEVADALAHAHAEGVVHRDVKPENILLPGRHAVLTDFGVARALAVAGSGGRLTETGMVVGTPAYMSPEQAAGERNVDERADVYALAVVGYEMLAGRPPFEGPSPRALLAAHLVATPAPLRDVRPETPRRVAEAVALALAKDPAERLRTAAELRDAVAQTSPEIVGAGAAWRRIAAGILGAALVASLGVWWAGRSSTGSSLDENLVAVAPFDVLGPGLDLWREGLVDLLSRNLDGAGTLRTVPPSIVVRRWSGRADPPSAAALGRRTGARLAVFGQLVATRADSVRLAATLYDVEANRGIGEVEFRDLASGMDRLADSLTVGLLRELARSRRAGIAPAATVRPKSLAALKAFLQGEQFFRRTAWDAALDAYGRAVALDSGFALAWRRLGTVTGWQVIGGDSLAGVYFLRAAALNRGLPPRESLLVTVDSLTTALFTNSADTAWRTHQARLFGILNEAARRFPEDPEVWTELGDARFHFRLIGRTPLEDVLAPFDRAIALDSAFGEAYLHSVLLALQLGRPEAARRYVRAFLGRYPNDRSAARMRLTDAVLAQSGARTPALERLIDTSDAEVLYGVYDDVAHWPDSQETVIRVARALAASGPSRIPLFNDPTLRRELLAWALAYRGHLREAFAVGGDSLGPVGQTMALGGVPRASAVAFFRRTLEELPVRAGSNALPFGFRVALFDALPWWAGSGDTASLAEFGRRMAALARAPSTPRDVVPWYAYGTTAAEGYLAVARGDTTEALRRFTLLPDTICPCVLDQVVESELLLGAGKVEEAAAVFRGHYPPFTSPAEGLWRLQRGRALERLGRREEAAADYRFVADVWRNADPELQPYVGEARAALSRLRGESRR